MSVQIHPHQHTDDQEHGLKLLGPRSDGESERSRRGMGVFVFYVHARAMCMCVCVQIFENFRRLSSCFYFWTGLLNPDLFLHSARPGLRPRQCRMQTSNSLQTMLAHIYAERTDRRKCMRGEHYARFHSLPQPPLVSFSLSYDLH